MKRSFRRPPLRQILPNLIAFCFGLGAAWFLDWETADLVWSLWLSSLVIGYLTILLTIAAAVSIGILVLRHDDFPRDKRVSAIVGGSVLAGFMLVFFSFHFCAFHAGHAVFLSSFFPLEVLPDNAFFDAFMNPLKLWKTALTRLFPLYGIFIVAAAIVERRHLAAPFVENLRRRPIEPGENAIKSFLKVNESRKHQSFNNPMIRPYVNVVRMHLLIFFFAGAHALDLDSFAVYSVVYAVYFFPWSDVFVRGEKDSP